MFAVSKYSCIFAAYLTDERVESAAFVAICLLSIVYIQQQEYCCTHLVVAAKPLLTRSNVWVQQFFLFNLFFIRQMNASVKNANGVNNSTTKAQLTHETGISAQTCDNVFKEKDFSMWKPFPKEFIIFTQQL